MEPPLLDAVALVRLLADDARRRAVAALLLGAVDTAGVTAATGLGTREVVTAVGRLVDAGLVEQGSDGTLVVLAEAFTLAARAAAPTPPEDTGASSESAKVLRAFVRDGRLTAIPAQHTKRLVVLDLLAQEFEPGRRYREPEVNRLLARWHDDVAALRRYLVDDGFLDRDAGEYWRAGGSIPI